MAIYEEGLVNNDNDAVVIPENTFVLSEKHFSQLQQTIDPLKREHQPRDRHLLRCKLDWYSYIYLKILICILKTVC